MGVLDFGCATSSSIHSSCSWPSVPSPPAFRFSTFTSPMKCTPFLSKLYHPAPLVPFPVLLAIIIQHVVLARHIEHIFRACALQNLINGVELFGFREVADVARVQHELRWRRQTIDF